jgi:hypothetical protein
MKKNSVLEQIVSRCLKEGVSIRKDLIRDKSRQIYTENGKEE